MRKLNVLSTALLLSATLNATTVYYNGENNDIGAWSIAPGSHVNSALREVHDNTLNSTVMEFTDGGLYRLRLPGENIFWGNTTERVLSLDMNLDSDFTLNVFVQTEMGLRSIFYNRLNINAGHHNNTANHNILCAIGHNRMFRVGAEDTGWGNNPQHRNNRNGWVRVTLDLEEQLRDTEPDNRITSVLSMRITGTSGRIDNVTLDAPNRVNRGTWTGAWVVSPNVPAGGTIARVQDSAQRGRVMEFRGVDGSNSFTTGSRTGRHRWNDTVHDIIQWKMQTEDPYKFIVHVNTQNGLRDLVYHGGKRRADMLNDQWWENSMDAIEERGLEDNGEIYIGLGIRRHLGDESADNNNDGFPDYDSGTGPTWQTFTRNVATDIAEFENGNRLIAINGVTVMGTNEFEHDSPMIDSTIRVDDIQLFTAVVPTEGGDDDDGDDDDGEDRNEEATDLHTWRLRETSLRVSFVDNANGETGFRFINDDTGETLGNQLPATAGTGTASIGQINGLTAGTTYRVRVETLFDDGRDTAVSEPIEFTTVGITPPPPPPEETNEEATDLHRWRLRDTSVRVSFVDNANGETGFRFINTDTGRQLGEELPATAGRGTASIGQINGLTPGTTYHVRVQTLFNDGRATATSETLTFTTTGTAPHGGTNSNSATNLHRWRLKPTSVKISFTDNSLGEIGFRFVNADTGENMGTLVSPSSGTGGSRIGKINGLRPSTTYRIRVHTLFNNGTATAISEPIEFTTPSR